MAATDFWKCNNLFLSPTGVTVLACQRTASFAATVRPVPLGRHARPCDPWRMHIRLRVAVLRIPPRSASVCSACGGETCRPWHLGCSSRLRGTSASLPLPASPLPSPSRRFAPRRFVGRIRPPRLAACSAAHATNRAAACRSARRSAPRVASSASKRCASSAPFARLRLRLRRLVCAGVPAEGASRPADLMRAEGREVPRVRNAVLQA